MAWLPEVGGYWKLKRNRGLPYRWRVEAVETNPSQPLDYVWLRSGERSKRINTRTLRGDYEQVEGSS